MESSMSVTKSKLMKISLLVYCNAGTYLKGGRQLAPPNVYSPSPQFHLLVTI